MSRCHPAVTVLTLLVCTASAVGAQQPPLYVRRSTPVPERRSLFAAPQTQEMLTFEQQLAIAPVRYPAVWTAPRVPAGTILRVPPRPKRLPGPGEYWGPFTNDLGGWGFMVGPLPAPQPQGFPQAWPPVSGLRQRGGFTRPTPPPPHAPVLPVAGPISPEGRMVVTYPDGSQVTWQFPMVEYSGTWNGVGAEGGLQISDPSGRQRVFEAARNTRYIFRGQNIDPQRVPAGAKVRARAMQSIPMTLTVLEFTQ